MADSLKTLGSTQAQFSAILEGAAKSFSDASGEKLVDFLNPPLKSVADLTRQLDLQNNDFGQFRARRQKIFSTLAAALTPVEVIGEIVAGAASDTFSPAEGIFGAVAYLIGGARDVSAIYDAIVELFEQLKVSHRQEPRAGRMEESRLTAAGLYGETRGIRQA